MRGSYGSAGKVVNRPFIVEWEERRREFGMRHAENGNSSSRKEGLAVYLLLGYKYGDSTGINPGDRGMTISQLEEGKC